MNVAVITPNQTGFPIMWHALAVSIGLVVIVLLVLFLETLPDAISAQTERWAKRLRDAGRYRSAIIVSWGIPLLVVLLVAMVWVWFWLFGDN